MLDHVDTFARRHLGSMSRDLEEMLKVVNAPTLDALVDQTVPRSIRVKKPLALPPAMGEFELLAELKGIAEKNQVFKSFIGAGLLRHHHPRRHPAQHAARTRAGTPPYTPYQAEIAQGRLEALLNYQTMICDLTGLPVANASLLDEGTAAAEAMHMAALRRQGDRGARLLRQPALPPADHRGRQDPRAAAGLRR